MTDPYKEIYNNVTYALVEAMNRFGEEFVKDARFNLVNGKHGVHLQSGELYRSIRQETKLEGDKVHTYLYADAQSPEGAKYAEFIEYGTGAAHGRPGGRVGTWRYKDRNGKWHTTDGMDADPFITPAFEDNFDIIEKLIEEFSVDIAKYRGMEQ